VERATTETEAGEPEHEKSAQPEEELTPSASDRSPAER
jgi:hypothetical protein